MKSTKAPIGAFFVHAPWSADVADRPKLGPFDFFGWLKAQMARMPLLAVAGAVAMMVADTHYDARYVKQDDGVALKRTVEDVQHSVAEIRTTQAVTAEQVRNINENVGDLKKSQNDISDKLDRLIERR